MLHWPPNWISHDEVWELLYDIELQVNWNNKSGGKIEANLIQFF